MQPAAPTGYPAGYMERLWPGGWVWAFAATLAASCGAVVARFDGRAALATAATTAVLLAVALLATTPTVAVADAHLIAGRARIPVALVGSVDLLDAAAMRQARGPDLDVRAYLCLRGWIAMGVRVALDDPDDPTPYWLISSRHPDRLARALTGR